jgi:uncharacterized protein
MLLTVFLLSALFAQQAQRGPAALEPKQGHADIAAVQKLAEGGQPEAQFKMGEAYENGWGVPQNDQEAAKWYQKAAMQGNAAAQVGLGVLLWTGRGVSLDKAKAVEWYRKSAGQGNGAGMFNLGAAYFNGEGVTFDSSEALAWFLVAQDHGSRPAVAAVQRLETTMRPEEIDRAYSVIAKRYTTGNELKQDYAAAATWYQRAAERGDSAAAVELADMYAQGRGEAQDYSATQHWCRYAAERQNRMGMYCMGWIYQEGKVGPKDPATAVGWFEKAAALGDAPSCFKLGKMYWTGDGVKADKVTAYKWVLLASTVLPEAKQEAEIYRAAMDEKEVEKAQRKVRDYMKTAHISTIRRPVDANP